MLSTSYLPLTNITQSQIPKGGIVALWFVPVQHVVTFPNIHPDTGLLEHQIVLKPNTDWYGPIKATPNTIQLKEQYKYTKAGHYFENTIEAQATGHATKSWLNYNLLVHQKCLVVTLLRNNGLFAVYGTPQSPCGIQVNYNSSSPNLSVHSISFTNEQYFKAPLLPQFKPCFVANAASSVNTIQYLDNQPIIPPPPIDSGKYNLNEYQNDYE